MENRGEREARRGLGSMGRVARWLRELFGGGKKAAAASSGAPPEAREKKRWGSFVKSLREKEKRSEAVRVAAAAASYREVDGRDEDEQNKRAIAVAAATAAVAEAAVAAAQAAAAVVRLTSSGRVGGGKREESAAVRIQAAFRAYLARRALRALKGLVKLQALVRGNIVRKQAAETLRCMQALVRVQARARACRALRSDRNQLKSSSRTHPGAATPEKSEQSVRSNACKAERSSTLRRNSSKQTCANDARFDQDRAQTSALELRWLDQWMEERYCDNTTKSGMVDDEKNAKILEIDTGKPHYGSGSKRKSSNYVHSSCSPLTSDQLSHSFTTMPDSPSKDSTIAQQSIPRSSSVDMQSLSPLRFPIADGCDYIESPQFFSASSSRPPSSRRGPFTPAKSECSRSLFSGYSDYPNFMANTESSRAKVRSQSAPKQRPEFGKSGSMWRTSAGHGFGQQQSGSAATQRSSSSSLHAKFTNKAYPGSGRLDR